jgi:hypothetical protein
MKAKPRRRGATRAGFLALLVFPLTAQPAWALLEKLGLGSRSEPFPVIHSKYAAEDQGLTSRLSWLDNDRLLFVGEPINEVLARIVAQMEKKASVKRRNLRFYIWNTRTNEVQTYKEVGERGRFCYNEMENWIRYRVPGKTNAVMEGKFGAEREIEIDPAEHTSAGRLKRGVFFDELTCREHPYAPKDSGVAERRVSPLFLDHGILDVWGNQIDARPIKLFSSDYGRAIELPLPRAAIAPEKIYYSQYKRAYVLFGFTAPPSFSNNWGAWPRGVNQPVYLLSPSGKLTLAAEVPWRKYFGRALGAFFTVRGLVFATGRAPENEGLFWVSDGRAIRVLNATGPVAGGGVSPDGCKMAAAISMDGANKSGGVKLIDFCRGEKR